MFNTTGSRYLTTCTWLLEPIPKEVRVTIDIWFVVTKIPNGLFFLLYEIAYVVGEWTKYLALLSKCPSWVVWKFELQFERLKLITWKTFWQHKTTLHCSQRVFFKLSKFADTVVFASESSYVKRMFYPTVTAISLVPNRLDFVAKIVEIPLFALVCVLLGRTSGHVTCATLNLSRQNPPKHAWPTLDPPLTHPWPNRN